MKQLPAFHETTFTPVTGRDGASWVTAPDLARALGYERSDAVNRHYQRHAAEFSEAMTQLLPRGGAQRQIDVPLTTETRIFSLRGAHLVAMFAKTARAAQFRRWVLDLLDRRGGSGGEALIDRLRAWSQDRCCCTTTEAAVVIGSGLTAESLSGVAALLRMAGWRRGWIRGPRPDTSVPLQGR